MEAGRHGEKQMNWLTTAARYFFGIAFVCFGIQHVIAVTWPAGPGAGPPWMVGPPFWAFDMALFLIAAGILLAANKMARRTGPVLAVVIVVYVLILYVPAMVVKPRDPGKWTSASELVCLAGAALVLAGVLSTAPSQPRHAHAQLAIDVGRWMYAIPLIVFGIQHLLYGKFVASLVTPWIPWHLFWAYFVGAAFLIASVSIATKVKGHLAAMLLGIMFFLWVIVLHAPRVAGAPHNGKEWTSLFVAMAMSGGAFAIAAVLEK